MMYSSIKNKSCQGFLDSFFTFLLLVQNSYIFQGPFDSVEIRFCFSLHEMRMDSSADGTQQRSLRFLHPLHILQHIASRVKVQRPFQAAIDIMLDDDIFDNPAIIDDGIELRFHLFMTVAADDDAPHAISLCLDKTISPRCRKDFLPLCTQ